MAEEATNLQKLSPSKKKLQAGDVFVMKLRNSRYLFGRVIDTDAVSGLGVPGAILIYVYRWQSDSREMPPRGELRPDRRLISPMMTNRLPWSRGYFETIGHVPLDEDDILPQHCFLSAVRGTYHDEKGNELPGPTEPVGDYGLHSYRTIDDEISGALGIALAPE